MSINIACTYEDAGIVNIVEIRPSELTGYIEIAYVDSNSDLVRVTIPHQDPIATNVTSINGRLTT